LFDVRSSGHSDPDISVVVHVHLRFVVIIPDRRIEVFAEHAVFFRQLPPKICSIAVYFDVTVFL